MIDPARAIHRSDADSLSVAMEALLQQQAADWVGGTPQTIRAYLDGDHAALDRRALLLELIHQEVLLRQARGESPELKDYAEDYPEIAESLQRLFEIQGLCAAAGELSGAVGETSSSDSMHPPAALESCTHDADDLPSLFGRYRVKKKLGHGGMGVVYLAHDLELDRSVALKVLRGEYERHPEFIARLQNEARAAAAVDHPGFCRVYEVGQINDRHYIAMAYIEGRPLSALIDPGDPMDVDEAVAWVLRLATILAEAHDRRIVHRDLKPSNVMVNHRREPIITDFGLARRLEFAGPDLTSTGQILGSPHYMAPEQVEGISGMIGPACDIYSLGVIFYELLTGQRPFRGSTPRILASILMREPAPLASLRPEIDNDLDRICRRAMAKKIEDRYPSMRSLADALATWRASHRPGVLTGSSERTHLLDAGSRGVPAVKPSSAFSPRSGGATNESPTGGERAMKHWKAPVLALVIGVLAMETWRAFGHRGESEDEHQRTLPSPPVPRASAPERAISADEASYVMNSLGMELRRIEPGEFVMGSPDNEGFEDEHPQHGARITKPFFLGVYEVSQSQYRALIDNDRSGIHDENQTPIVSVDWFDAVNFCNQLSLAEHLPPYYRLTRHGADLEAVVLLQDGPGYRLPTEAEWEYACRAGTWSVYPFDGDETALGQNAWFLQNSSGQVHAIGKKQPNAWGLYDMLGNAWEWCQDGYDPAYYLTSPDANPRGPLNAATRVIRGGSVFDDLWCRSAARQGHPPTTRLEWLGFRVAAYRVAAVSLPVGFQTSSSNRRTRRVEAGFTTAVRYLTRVRA